MVSRLSRIILNILLALGLGVSGIMLSGIFSGGRMGWIAPLACSLYAFSQIIALVVVNRAQKAGALFTAVIIPASLATLLAGMMCISLGPHINGPFPIVGFYLGVGVSAGIIGVWLWVIGHVQHGD